MEIEGVSSRSSFITFIGVLMGCFAVLGIGNELLSMLWLGTKIDSGTMVASLSKMGFHPVWLTSDNLKNIFTISVVVFLLIDIICLWAAVALAKRMAWARTFYLVYFALLIARDIIIIGLSVISRTVSNGLTEEQKNSHTLATLQNILIAMVTANALFYLIVLLKLSSKKIKREFQPAWMR